MSDDLEQLKPYLQWDRKRLRAFLTAQACSRLTMLRHVEEQRQIALPATLDQERFLLQLLCAMEESGPEEPAQQNANQNPPDADELRELVGEPKSAFDRLDASNRMLLRDSAKELLRIIDLEAEELAQQQMGTTEGAEVHDPQTQQEVRKDKEAPG